MRKLLTLLIPMAFPLLVCCQTKLDKVLERMNEESVPYVTVDQAIQSREAIFLDTREANEFEISHIGNALWVGYDHFDMEKVTNTILEKETPIIVYCSIGVRSEDIGEQLMKAGYTNVKNLYGGIFEWKNQEQPVFRDTVETQEVHAYNRIWGRFLKKGKKVYQ
ncbi:MAG: rhodanese-like domain-containing protein [Flavobacteriaceae bacterium]